MIRDLYVLFRGFCLGWPGIIITIGVVIAVLNPHIEFNVTWGDKDKDKKE